MVRLVPRQAQGVTCSRAVQPSLRGRHEYYCKHTLTDLSLVVGSRLLAVAEIITGRRKERLCQVRSRRLGEFCLISYFTPSDGIVQPARVPPPLSLNSVCFRYVTFCMKRVNLLRGHEVEPIMVFDGASLPMKGSKHLERRRWVAMPTEVENV